MFSVSFSILQRILIYTLSVMSEQNIELCCRTVTPDQVCWLIPVVLATEEVKVRRMFQNQLKQNIRKTPISTNELGNL
jgi:hypothetical protein